MPLTAGTRLGAYEIVDAIGAGGMGEVYRALDTRLRREVAVKILPDAFAADPDRIARFQREAELLATLNHPNIAAVYGVEESAPSTGSGQAVSAIVLELVEGDTLADRIARGPLPIDEAIPIARQIVDALEAAHDRGVIHRDLKPANIKITPDGKVKVLDFGLAKMAEREASAAGLSLSPTLSVHATYAGAILGTAAYMSPEQARGKAVDRRTDIWAFGCVLFEMLTGQRPFDAGETVSDAVAAILRSDPDWNALPPDLPPHLRTLLRRCLQKDPQKRLPHIGIVRFEIDEGPTGAAPAAIAPPQPIAPAKPVWRRALPVATTAIVAGALAAVAGWYFKPAPPQPVTRFPLALGEGQNFANLSRPLVAISPDGSQIVYAANSRLYLRSMADLEARPIAGTEVTAGGVTNPVFSPDGRAVAYASGQDSTLKRIAVSGGAPVTVCPLETTPYGMSWDASGILFQTTGKGIFRVSASGGKPELLIPIKPGELVNGPRMLPDRETVLFAATTGVGAAQSESAQVVAHSLKSGQRKTLVEGGIGPRYVPTGHLAYVVRGVVFAIPFDVRRLEVTGGPVPLIEGVRSDSGTAHYAFADTGSLVYLPGPVTGSSSQQDLALIDRKGDVQPLKLPMSAYATPRVSPDGRQVAFGVDDGKEQMVWVYDLSGTTSMRRLTFGGRNRFPVWSADSKRVAFQSDREGDTAVFWQTADGATTAERLTKAEPGTLHTPESWSPDGRHLLFSVTKGSNVSLWILSLQDKKPSPFGAVESNNPINATFSPDGRWVAYQSTEAGAMQIYVQPFPATGAKYQVSKTITNSHYPLWSRDGKNLFYIPGRLQFVVVSVTTAPSFAFSNPTPLPRSIFTEGGPTTMRSYDAAKDGRLLAVIAAGQTTSVAPIAPHIQVVLNWFTDLKQRVPVE